MIKGLCCPIQTYWIELLSYQVDGKEDETAIHQNKGQRGSVSVVPYVAQPCKMSLLTICCFAESLLPNTHYARNAFVSLFLFPLIYRSEKK